MLKAAFGIHWLMTTSTTHTKMPCRKSCWFIYATNECPKSRRYQNIESIFLASTKFKFRYISSKAIIQIHEVNNRQNHINIIFHYILRAEHAGSYTQHSVQCAMHTVSMETHMRPPWILFWFIMKKQYAWRKTRVGRNSTFVEKWKEYELLETFKLSQYISRADGEKQT